MVTTQKTEDAPFLCARQIRDAVKRDIALSEERQAMLAKQNAQLQRSLAALREELAAREAGIVRAEEEYEGRQDDLEELRQLTDEMNHELSLRGRLLTHRQGGGGEGAAGAVGDRQLLAALAALRREGGPYAEAPLHTLTVTHRLAALDALFAQLSSHERVRTLHSHSAARLRRLPHTVRTPAPRVRSNTWRRRSRARRAR